MNVDPLAGQIAVVTGGGRGIGSGIAIRLALEGALVAVLDINYESARSTTNQIEDYGKRAMAFAADVADRSNIRAVFEQLTAELGSPRILVNNAGIYTSSPLLEVTEEEWGRTISVNLSGVFYCSQAIAPYLIERRGGRIINISSIGAKIGWPRNHAYCASKAGVIGLTRVLALDLAPYGITVNAICPGNTFTDMLRDVDESICRTEGLEPGTFLREQLNNIPLGRYGQPADIAGLVAFLASSDAAHITGQMINVDGGLVMY